MTKNKEKEETYRLAEMCISVGDGHVTVTEDDNIEFVDCLPINIDVLESIIKEARDFIVYRDDRNEQLDKIQYNK